MTKEPSALALSTLDAVAGPLKGSSFPLAGEATSIGREPSNTIAILDGSVSRHHCVVRRERDQFIIADLDSRNGTLVNRVPVKERVLQAGDEIRVGNSLFVFLSAESDDSTGSSPSVELSKEGPVAGSTIILRKEHARYLAPSAAPEALQPTSRVVRDLDVLLKISTSLNRLRRVADIERQVLASVLEVAPADRAAILLVEDNSSEFTSVLVLDAKSGKESAAAENLSRTVLAQVHEQGVAILSNDVGVDANYETVESLIAPQVQSLLVVPLEFLGRIRGVEIGRASCR